MGAWAIFWGILLVVTLLFYSVLVVYVTLGGYSDIKQMFKSLAEPETDDPGGAAAAEDEDE